MIGRREFSDYKPQHLPAPDRNHFHKTFTPESEDIGHVKFDFRFAGRGCHVSSTMFLERQFTLEPRYTNEYNKYYGRPELVDDVPNEFAFYYTKYCVKPGFLLQKNCTNFVMNYNSTTDETKNANIWLDPYCRLYKDKLKNLIRGSGRTVESNSRNGLPIGRQMHDISQNQDNVRNLAELGSLENYPAHLYSFPDRIERRIVPYNPQTLDHVDGFMDQFPENVYDSIFHPFNIQEDLDIDLRIPAVNEDGEVIFDAERRRQRVLYRDEAGLVAYNDDGTLQFNDAQDEAGNPIFEDATDEHGQIVFNLDSPQFADDEYTFHHFDGEITDFLDDYKENLYGRQNRLKQDESLEDDLRNELSNHWNGRALVNAHDVLSHGGDNFADFKALLYQIFPGYLAVENWYSYMINQGLIVAAPGEVPQTRIDGGEPAVVERDIGVKDEHGNPEQVAIYTPIGKYAFNDEYGWGVDLTKPFMTLSQRTKYRQRVEEDNFIAWNTVIQSASLAYRALYDIEEYWFSLDSVKKDTAELGELHAKCAMANGAADDPNSLRFLEDEIVGLRNIINASPNVTVEEQRVRSYEESALNGLLEKWREKTGLAYTYTNNHAGQALSGRNALWSAITKFEHAIHVLQYKYRFGFLRATQFNFTRIGMSDQYTIPQLYLMISGGIVERHSVVNRNIYDALNRNLEAQLWHEGMRQLLAAEQYFELTPFNENQKVQFDLKIIEPLVCSIMRPTEYRDIGCWSLNSNVIPHIERFSLMMKFDTDNSKYFELDEFALQAIATNEYLNTHQLPRLCIQSAKSKLHCTFIEHIVNVPRALTTLNYQTFKLASVEASGPFVASHNNFQDIEIRNGVQMLMFFCKTTNVPLQGNDNTADILTMKLRSDVSNEHLHLTSRHHINAITTRNFPDYCPPIGVTGNVLAITYNEVPRSREVQVDFNHLSGFVDTGHTSDYQISYDVYLVVIYKDSFVKLTSDYAHKERDLLY